MNGKISGNEKQLLKRRNVGPWCGQKHKPLINIAQGDDSNIFESLHNL